MRVLVKLAIDPESCVQQNRVLRLRDILHTAGHTCTEERGTFMTDHMTNGSVCVCVCEL